LVRRTVRLCIVAESQSGIPHAFSRRGLQRVSCLAARVWAASTVGSPDRASAWWRARVLLYYDRWFRQSMGGVRVRGGRRGCGRHSSSIAAASRACSVAPTGQPLFGSPPSGLLMEQHVFTAIAPGHVLVTEVDVPPAAAPERGCWPDDVRTAVAAGLTPPSEQPAKGEVLPVAPVGSLA